MKHAPGTILRSVKERDRTLAPQKWGPANELKHVYSLVYYIKYQLIPPKGSAKLFLDVYKKNDET